LRGSLDQTFFLATLFQKFFPKEISTSIRTILPGPFQAGYQYNSPVAQLTNKSKLNKRAYMKKLLSSALVILSVAVGVNGAPPVATGTTATSDTTAGAFIPPPFGGAMSPGGVGGQLFPGPVGGTLNPGGFLGPLTPGSSFVYGIPGGSLYSNPNVLLRNQAPLAPAGGALNGSGVGGVKSSVIVTGGATAPPGGTLSGGGVGGVKSSVIVAGGASTPGTGGALSNGGTGGSLSAGQVTGSASSVIVTGGSKP
jgi:hypothetical protein